MRIDYVPIDLDEPADIVDAIRKRRGGTLLELDRMLLHSPPYAAAWNHFLGVVRNALSVSPKLAELAICLVAVLNRADYELEQHGPLFIAAGGSEPALDALINDPDPAENTLFASDERAVIRLTTEMTRNITISDETFAAAREIFPDERGLVEMIGVVAAYNMVSRFLVALGVETQD